MAIIKTAAKITVNVKKECLIQAGKQTEIAGSINIEAKQGNLSLNSLKRIISRGNKK
ncbi:hypothetical protein QEG73_23020 [Chitinophagaceae bacterium 26-R-25]|nr:hypothetical protein [Chitinophagaceae bacterium 26-R-25]